MSGWPAGLGRIMEYQRPFRAQVARDGLLAVAPVSMVLVLVTLAVSAAWRDPLLGHRLAVACCAWRAADLRRGPLPPLLGSAFLDQRLIEAMWTVTAGWLLFGPLEAAVGGRWLVAIAAAGHVVPTVLIDLCWLAGPGTGHVLSGLDVGTSAMVVTAAAALAVSYRSLPVAVLLAGGLAVDIVVAPDMATAEHLLAVAIGTAGALAARRGRALRVPAEPAQGDGESRLTPRPAPANLGPP